MNKLFLKLQLSEFKNSSRNERELSVVSELNVPIVVLAKGKRNSITKIKGFEVHQINTRPLSEKNYGLLSILNKLISVILFSLYIKKLKPDYISCSNLLALIVAYASFLFSFNSKKPLLIYDSHEFELGRNVKRSKFTKAIIKCAEAF